MTGPGSAVVLRQGEPVRAPPSDLRPRARLLSGDRVDLLLSVGGSLLGCRLRFVEYQARYTVLTAAPQEQADAAHGGAAAPDEDVLQGVVIWVRP